MKNDRLFQILYLLLENNGATAPELAEKLGVSVRTVYRDVDTLALAGIPIHTVAGRSGGISLMPGFSLERSLLSKEEQDRLLFALQSLRAVDQPVEPLLQKLGAAFHRPPTDWIAVDFTRWGLHRADSERFAKLRDAILNRQILCITYCGASGEKSRRLVCPVRLVYKDKSWYLQGYCQRSQAFRLFKMGRILQAVPTSESFPPFASDAVPSPEIHPPAGFETPLVLHFSPAVAYRVYDEFETGSITEEPDGRLLVETSFPLDRWVVSYLLSFGTDLEIRAPASLRKQVAAFAKKIAEHHKT